MRSRPKSETTASTPAQWRAARHEELAATAYQWALPVSRRGRGRSNDRCGRLARPHSLAARNRTSFRGSTGAAARPSGDRPQGARQARGWPWSGYRRRADQEGGESRRCAHQSRRVRAQTPAPPWWRAPCGCRYPYPASRSRRR